MLQLVAVEIVDASVNRNAAFGRLFNVLWMPCQSSKFAKLIKITLAGQR